MQFISNEKTDLVLKTLLNKDFNIHNVSSINTMKFDGDKIKYGYVSKFIKDMDPDTRDILQRNTELCISISDMLQFNDVFMQILNHIILEVPRASEIDLIKVQSQKYSQQNREFRNMQREFYNKVEDFEKDFNNVKDEFKTFETRIGSIQSEFIGILSIFAAMFITFFGGVQMLGSLMTAIENSNFYVLSMITIIVGLIMFNIIYMLLYTVGKIINKNIGINIYKSNCSNCSQKSLLSCIISKYPLPFFYNLFSIIVFILILIFYMMDNYGIIKYFTTSLLWLLNHKMYINIILIFVVTIFILFSAVYLLFNKINEMHKSKTCTNKGNTIESTIQASALNYNS
ncbi:MAG: hypothetical protein RR942_18380 [Romboutsia sp.]